MADTTDATCLIIFFSNDATMKPRVMVHRRVDQREIRIRPSSSRGRFGERGGYTTLMLRLSIAKSPLPTFVLLGSIVAAGCGGGGHDSKEGVPGLVNFSHATNFNGDSSPLRKFSNTQSIDSGTSVEGRGSVVTERNGLYDSRHVYFKATGAFQEGATLNIDGETKFFEYFESRNSSSSTNSWVAKSGTIVVLARNASHIVVEFKNVRVEANTSTPARGAITLTGTLDAEAG
jgi:hypothetical protein